MRLAAPSSLQTDLIALHPESLFLFKAASVLALLLISWAGLAFPFLVRWIPGLLRYSSALLSAGNAFSGGVMLATGFLHMLADASNTLQHVQVDPESAHSGKLWGLPIPFVVNAFSVLGIMLPLFLEKTGFLVVVISKSSECDLIGFIRSVCGAFQRRAERRNTLMSWLFSFSATKMLPAARYRSVEQSSIRQDLDEPLMPPFSMPVMESQRRDANPEVQTPTEKRVPKDLSFRRIWGEHREHAARQLVFVSQHPAQRFDSWGFEYLSLMTCRKLQNLPRARSDSSLVHLPSNGQLDVEERTSSSNDPCCPPPQHPSSQRSPSIGRVADVLLLAVLSIHAFFAGVALGLSSRASALPVLLALLLHKFFEATSLGISISRSGRERCTVILEASFFSSATPLGVLLGVLSSVGGGISQTTSGFVMAISGGTFIYIALVEILQEEFDSHSHGPGQSHKLPPGVTEDSELKVSPLVKYLCWSVGVLCMGALGIVA